MRYKIELTSSKDKQGRKAFGLYIGHKDKQGFTSGISTCLTLKMTRELRDKLTKELK